MKDIELVIKMSEEYYDEILTQGMTRAHLMPLYKALVNSKPLPKGQWTRMSDLSEQEDDRYKCSRCGNVIHYKNKMDLYTFNSWCGRCGSDNSR